MLLVLVSDANNGLIEEGAEDRVNGADETAAPFKCEQVHISDTEYTKGEPRPPMRDVSVQVVIFRVIDEQACWAGAFPTAFVTFQDEKLQYELEQALAPGVHVRTNALGVEAVVENDKEEGVEAHTGKSVDLDELWPSMQVQPSTTV
jgi:hypothetical protein